MTENDRGFTMFITDYSDSRMFSNLRGLVMVVKVGVAKLGNIASGVMVELLLDERADRTDMQTFMATSGTKLEVEDVDRVVKNLIAYKPDFAIVVSPNGVLPGPTGAREALKAAGIPVVVITDDVTTKKEWADLKESDFGYIIQKADSMIGARREFLDPTEMSDYNGNLIKVLTVTGAFRKMQFALDAVIDQVKAGKSGAELELPKIVMTADKAVKDEFTNPYAYAKARAAFEIAAAVAMVNVKGCFMTKGFENYVPIVASAHEMMRAAMLLCEEAREMEKAGDAVIRMPHKNDGTIVSKTKLISKPE
jgi:methylenetetrahydromethanopterin dehydrogenase